MRKEDKLFRLKRKSIPKSWSIFQKCHYGNIWSRVKLNGFQKGFFVSVKNWIEAKKLTSILLRRTWPLLWRASVMPSTPLTNTVLPPFLSMGELKMRSFFFILKTHSTSLFLPPSIASSCTSPWFSSPLAWFWTIIKDWLGLRCRLYWSISYGGGDCYGGITVAKKSNIWSRFSAESKQKDIVYVLDSLQNRGRKEFLASSNTRGQKLIIFCLDFICLGSETGEK